MGEGGTVNCQVCVTPVVHGVACLDRGFLLFFCVWGKEKKTRLWAVVVGRGHRRSFPPPSFPRLVLFVGRGVVCTREVLSGNGPRGEKNKVRENVTRRGNFGARLVALSKYRSVHGSNSSSFREQRAGESSTNQ